MQKRKSDREIGEINVEPTNLSNAPNPVIEKSGVRGLKSSVLIEEP